MRIINDEILDDHDDQLFYVYMHIKKDDKTPFYIGKGKLDRCFSKSCRNKFWKNIVSKHGFLIKILEINLLEDDAFKKEIFWIKFFKRTSDGGVLCNLTDGGEGLSGRIVSDEERKNMSERFKNPEENKKGNRINFFGKKLYGKDNPNFNNKGIKNSLSKPVVQLDLKGNFISRFNSIAEASEILNISGISEVCKNKRNQLHGFKFCYESDYNTNNYNIKLGITNKKEVNMIDKNTNEIIKTYNSASETKNDGFNPLNVSQVCRKEKKTHLGYKWEYKQDIV